MPRRLHLARELHQRFVVRVELIAQDGQRGPAGAGGAGAIVALVIRAQAVDTSHDMTAGQTVARAFRPTSRATC